MEIFTLKNLNYTLVMKTLSSILLFLVVLFQGHLKAQSDQPLSVPLSEPGSPYKLNVHILSGSISVSGYEGKEILIMPDGGGSPRRETAALSGMRKITGANGSDISASVNNNSVTITTGIRASGTSLNLKIPRGATNVKLSTVNGGAIVVSNVNGDLELSNTNGAIRVTGATGSVVANTTNGAVNVTFKSVDPKAAMAFSTLNGNVDVTFPPTLKANLKMRTDNGEVFSDFDMENAPVAPKTTKTNKNGLFRIAVEDWINTRVGGGGPEIMLRNMNGNIYVRKGN